MAQEQNIQDVQERILQIMKFIDRLCRENGIVYYIMGGTALGAVRHGGFIPWDDDLDIFMTPGEYARFRAAMEAADDGHFVLQEWRSLPGTDPGTMEYAKVRMNGTAFIEEPFRSRRDLHQGIYVDIMLLHKCPTTRSAQKRIYRESRFVTLLGLSQRGWKPKSRAQALALRLLRVLPCRTFGRFCYRDICRYDTRQEDYMWCYYITKVRFEQGLFPAEMFAEPTEIAFEDTTLLAPTMIREYLTIRYGDYLTLPSPEQQRAAVHAWKYDTQTSYEQYIKG